MEPPVVRSRGRPRKRRREDAQNGENLDSKGNAQVLVLNSNDNNRQEMQNMGNPRKRGRPPKKRVVEIRGEAMVGRYVLKEFEGNGLFLGKIVSYDSGLYRVDYEDGDCEDLDSCELRDYLIGDERGKFVSDLLERKMKLDEHIAKKTGMKQKDELKEGDALKLVDELENGDVAKSMDNNNPDRRDTGNVRNDVGKIEVPTLYELSDEEVDGSEVDDDGADSSSDSCEYGQGWDIRSETEIPAVPPPELPTSSGTIGVPEEHVSYLLSVYGFLRSFSIRLFLSPFTLDDLVGCLNCTVPNTLLDAIHVALLRALRRHLEVLAADGSELASKCLRCIDWGLLDILTWPVYLVHYLMVMGHLNVKEWKGLYIDVLEKDYCTLSVGTKLMVLQILCDDALDTAEIRAETDMREASEVGVDSDGIMSNPFENGPRKVYPRSSKTSIAKDRESVILDADLSFRPNSFALKGNHHDRDADNVNEDENGDECRLCGMDGVLLCCDGCPSAYHSRCIGVSKLSIPDGEWFCPECTISRLGPPIAMGTSLKGAEVFGVDPYAQLFLGTCNHLLVLKVSVKTSPFVRYYNCNDIPKVVLALCSYPHHAVSYFKICQAILKYWELPQVVLTSVISSQTSMTLENKDEGLVLPFGENGSEKVLNRPDLENYACSVGQSFVNDISLGVPIQNDLITVPRMSGATINQIPTNMTTKLSKHAELFCSAQQGLADGSSMTGIAYRNESSTVKKNGICLPENLRMRGKEDSSEVGGKTVQKWRDTCLYMGSIFKPLAYINHYVHGDFAACAAANFAVLSSEENQASEVHASDPRKAMSANVMLQTKAFSSAAVRFFWPSTEKKLTEIPRERCSWCLHCKAPVTSKKACLLNQAALNATRAAMKFFSGLRLVKNVEGGLYGIAAYALYMEESLRGLILGPFQSATYQQQWRKQVEIASTCNEMKSLLLELEENLSAHVLSSEWTNLVDNWMDESSVPQSACASGSTQKRGTGRRRKHLAVSEVTADDSKDSLSDLSWRSGKLSKLVFQRGTLPCSVLRKAARQGGSRRIPGICYAEDSDVPKRSRQYIWRAAVQMSMNASGLALQVRYLDHHIKWSDLLRPEQNLQDGKGPETEASAFRNALICDKKVVENKIMYGVAFGHQKHLSSRLMKSIIEKEESQDGKDKYWFLETRIPLYLIKEYEKNAEKAHLPPSKKPDPLSKLQRRQLKASRKEIFLYLERKRENVYMCLCASCHRDVLLGIAVKCSTCEGYCHKGCTISSTVLTNEDVEFVTSCKQCSHGKVVTQNNSTVESPTSPLVMLGQDYQNSATVAKSARLKITSQQRQNSTSVAKISRPKSTRQHSQSVGTVESRSNKKPSLSDSNFSKNRKRPCHWGLIWKKKPTDDGSEFRSKNVLFRGNAHGENSSSPVCHLCHKPYSPHLMYIRCETCQHWHHADAVELDESKLSNLMGYKCCRCRRIKTPVCPYADLNLKKTEVRKLRIRGPKEETPVASVSETLSEQAESIPSTPMSPMDEDVFIQVDDPLLFSVSNTEQIREPEAQLDFEVDDPLLFSVSKVEQISDPKAQVDFEVDDPLLFSVSKVEQIPEPKAEVDFEWNTSSGPAPQKLPVRRHIKNDRDDEGLAWSDYSTVQLHTSVETKNIANPHAEWDVSNGGLDDGIMLEYENFNDESADYEPQTYFSYTELLEADDGNQFEGVDVSGDAWQNFECEYSQSGFPEQYETGPSNNHEPTSIEPAIEVSCNICSQAAPAPELVCYNCGLQIHSQCSPWEEGSQGDSWRCGSCREWH